jgi:hypothetical protein
MISHGTIRYLVGIMTLFVPKMSHIRYDHYCALIGGAMYRWGSLAGAWSNSCVFVPIISGSAVAV